MAKKSKKQYGVDKDVAKKVWEKVDKEMTAMKANINALIKDVNALNKDTWHGSKRSVKWYNGVEQVLQDLDKYKSKIQGVQNYVDNYFKKAKRLDDLI